MTIQAVTEEIGRLHEEMRKLTLEAFVPEGLYNRVLSTDDVTVYHLKERLEFLKGLRTAEYAEVEKIWALLPEATWTMYKSFGEYKLREQVLLRQARKALKKVWEKRYEDQRNKPAKETAGESVRSEEAGTDEGGA